jgi:hypothetical protein
MLSCILSLVVGFILGYGVRDVISRHRHKRFRTQRVRDRFAPNELDENLVPTLKQMSGSPPTADIKAAHEDLHL